MSRIPEETIQTIRDRADLVKPKAFVVPTRGYEGSTELEEQLVAHCVAHMAQYKRPRWVRFVDELPKTATGKIQRFRLRAEDESPNASGSGGDGA